MDMTKIVNDYYEMVHKIAYSKVLNKNDSNDICQSVFMKILENQEKLKSEEHIKWWLIRVTINCCKNYISSGWEKNTIYINDDLVGVLESNVDDFSIEDNYLVESEIYETVESLPEKYKTILKLFYFEDMSLEEISTITGVNTNTLKTRLRRSRDLLRVCLDSKLSVTNSVFKSLNSELMEYFKQYKDYYKSIGKYKKFGYGEKIAILNVDLCNGWTRSGSPFTCDVEEAIPAIERLCNAARESSVDIPIYFSKNRYKSFLTNSHLDKKMPIENMMDMDYLYSIDGRIIDNNNDIVVEKNGISCFQNTDLFERLNKDNIDTLIITGVTAGAAIRHTAMDAFYLGYSVIIPEETVSDRIDGAKQWNLFDIDMNFGDVLKLDDVISYISNLEYTSEEVRALII